MENIIGKASGADKNTIVQMKVIGTYDGILLDLDFKVISNNRDIEDFLKTIKAGMNGLTAGDVMEEITAENILENIELPEEDIYIAELIEKVFQKAVIDYIQQQLKIPVEQKYDEE